MESAYKNRRTIIAQDLGCDTKEDALRVLALMQSSGAVTAYRPAGGRQIVVNYRSGISQEEIEDHWGRALDDIQFMDPNEGDWIC